MSLETGERRLICHSGFVSGGIWSTDGTITFARGSRDGLYRVPEEGGDVVEIVASFDVDRRLAGALPNGRDLLLIRYLGLGIDILSGGEWTTILEGQSIASVSYSPTGHLLYHRPEDGLWAVPFSLETLSPTAGSVHVDPIGAWPTFSDNGRLSYKRGLDRNQFVLRDREGRVTQRIGRPQFNLQDPSVSPDGSVVAGIAFGGQGSVWLHEMDSGQARRLTFDVQAAPSSATWSPDGRYLYFVGTDGKLLKLDVRGEEALRTLVEGAHLPHVSTDGRYLAYESIPQGDIFYLELESDSPPRVFFEGPATETEPRFSPDGKVLAYVSDESGRNELYLRRFPSAEGLQQVSTGGGFIPRFSADGSELFFLRGRDLMAVPVSAGERLELGEPEELFTLSSPALYEYAVTRDGQFIEVQPIEETSTIAVVDQWQSFFEAANE